MTILKTFICWLLYKHPFRWLHYITQSLCHRKNVTQGQFLSGLKLVNQFSFSGCLTKVKEPSLLYYLPTAWKRKKKGFMPFQKAQSQSEMQPHQWFEIRPPTPFPTTETILWRSVPSKVEYVRQIKSTDHRQTQASYLLLQKRTLAYFKARCAKQSWNWRGRWEFIRIQFHRQV